MKIIDKKKDPKLILLLPILFIYVLTIFLLSYSVQNLNDSVSYLQNKVSEVESSKVTFEGNFAEELFNDHLSLLEKQKIENELESLKVEIENLPQEEDSDVTKVQEIYDLYEIFEKKVTRNDEVKIDTTTTEEKLNEWGTLLINKDFDALKTNLEETTTQLDSDYNDYLATLPPPEPVGGGYNYTTVNTEKGTFGVYLIKLSLNEYKVKTVSAAKGDCKDNCPTKSLGDFVSENNAIAGINGSYFCPPDYSSCGGKVNSFDYAFYDSNAKKWINKGALTWFDTGMIAFSGNSAKFYKKTSEYDGDSISAAISNYPALLKNGEVVIDKDILTSYQKDIRGTRGAIGVGDDNIYLALITNATVTDAAYAMKALGAKHALNIDGGGSSAMYLNGSYIVGPGRSLPNAIVLVK